MPNNDKGKSPVVELINVCKTFPTLRKGKQIPALENISLSIPDTEAGEFVAIIGPSGCGKSTVLNLISGLLAANSGQVLVFGSAVNGPNSQSVTVPQAYTCFPWLTALGNAEFGLAMRNMDKAKRREIAIEYLTKVGLGNRLQAYPRQLSGGMQQRVAIARTLAMKPRLVLMDEPFGALDAQTRSNMQQMLLDVWTQEKNTIIFVTHDISEALFLADRIILFSSMPARIVLDMRVMFPRPRLATLPLESEFVRMCQYLFGLLKHPGEDDKLPIVEHVDNADAECSLADASDSVTSSVFGVEAVTSGECDFAPELPPTAQEQSLVDNSSLK